MVLVRKHVIRRRKREEGRVGRVGNEGIESIMEVVNLPMASKD